MQLSFLVEEMLKKINPCSSASMENYKYLLLIGMWWDLNGWLIPKPCICYGTCRITNWFKHNTLETSKGTQNTLKMIIHYQSGTYYNVTNQLSILHINYILRRKPNDRPSKTMIHAIDIVLHLNKWLNNKNHLFGKSLIYACSDAKMDSWKSIIWCFAMNLASKFIQFWWVFNLQSPPCTLAH